MKVRSWLLLLAVAVLAVLTLFFYWKLTKSPYLTFSDAAKFADTARQITHGKFFSTNFSFFSHDFFELSGKEYFKTGLLPLYPFLLALSFITFGISDRAVILTSGLFFVISSLLVFLLAAKLFDKRVASLSIVAFIFSLPMLEYASIGASESLFILEILLVVYLLTFQETKRNFLAGLIVSLMFLTRQQALIYFLGFLLATFILAKRKLIISFLLGTLSFLIPLLIISKITGLYLFGQQPLSLLFESSSVAAQNVTLRGGINQFTLLDVLINFKPLAVKFFYNLYNFYKSLPTFLSPYLLTLFILGLFKKEKDSLTAAIKWATLTILVISFLGASLTIPFVRYVHPVIPLLIIFSVAFLIWLVEKLNQSHLLAVFLVLLFVVGQTLGQIFLDSRFLAKTVNRDKPPINFILGKMVGNEAKPNDLVVTNLDTWGTWYGQRKTIWLPFKPEQLISPDNQKTKIDAIFLTSYLANDPAQALGGEWQKVLDDPENITNQFLRENFYLAKKFKIEANDTYDNQSVYGIVLKKK